MARKRPRTFGAVRKLSSGRYQARYTGPDGERRKAPETFATIGEADAWLAEVHVQLRGGTWRLPELAQTQFGKYLDSWLDSRTDLSPRTERLYRRLTVAYLKPKHGSTELGEMPIGGITETVVREWRGAVSRAARKNSAPKYRHLPELPADAGATATAQAYRLLRTVLNTAVREGLISSNPCKIPKAGNTRRKDRTPATPTELTRAMKAMPERYRAAVLVAAFSSLRAGELFALARRHIDVDAGTIRVDRALIDLSGQPVSFGPPKSEAGARTVHVPRFVADALRVHLAEFTGDGSDALVFGTKNGTAIRGSNLGTMWRRARATVNRSDLRWHDLRHTGATMAAEGGASIKELMHRLGHSSPAAALIYQHRSNAADRRIAENLHARFSDGVAALGEEGWQTAA